MTASRPRGSHRGRNADALALRERERRDGDRVGRGDQDLRGGDRGDRRVRAEVVRADPADRRDGPQLRRGPGRHGVQQGQRNGRAPVVAGPADRPHGRGEERGWTDQLPESMQTTARYDERGVMGSGSWYGVPNYGEFVTVYYNKDAVRGVRGRGADHARRVRVRDGHLRRGRCDAAGVAGAEYPAGQLCYELALSQADRYFVNDYQLYTEDVDFQADPLKYGAETFDAWVKTGYIVHRRGEPQGRGHGRLLHQRHLPDDRLRLVVVRPVRRRRSPASTGASSTSPATRSTPARAATSGSSPRTPTNEELAYDFIDITMRPEIQALLGNNGGLPSPADPATHRREEPGAHHERSTTVLDNDGLAFYPDWPVPGYYDVLVSAFQSLINQSKSPDEVLSQIGAAYDDGVAAIE